MRAAFLAVIVLTAACRPTLVIDHRGDPGTPAPRTDASATYDSANGTIVMFGGADRSGVLSETWTWDGNGWRRQHPKKSPPGRELAFMGYDPATSKVVLFGGLTCPVPGADDPIGCDYQKNSTALADTWVWDGSGWSQLETRHAPPVTYFQCCYGGAAADMGHGKLILVTSGPPDPDFLAQTWVLDKGDWQRLHPNHSPLAQLFTGPAYDSVSGRLIVQQSHGPHIDYGPNPGPRPPTLKYNTTWSWDGSDWRDLGLSVRTPDSYGRLLSVGQQGLVLIEFDWLMKWTGSSWAGGQQLPEAISPAMKWREGWTAAYREPTHQLVLVGGRGGPGGNHLFADTAGLEGSKWATLVPAPPSPSVPLTRCSEMKALAGVGGGLGIGNSDASTLEVDFFEPRAGPCHLTTNVVLTLMDANGSLLSIPGNPSTQPINVDLTWEAGGQAVTFTVTGACTLGPGVSGDIRAGDFRESESNFVSPCSPDSRPYPRPSISSAVRPTGLRP